MEETSGSAVEGILPPGQTDGTETFTVDALKKLYTLTQIQEVLWTVLAVKYCVDMSLTQKAAAVCVHNAAFICRAALNKANQNASRI